MYAQFRDAANNESTTESDAITVDDTAPTGSVVIDSGAAFTDTTNVTLSLSAEDTGGSGLARMRFSNDGSSWSAWEAYGTSKSWTLAPGTGAKTVYVQFDDSATNVSASVSDGIALDASAPTGSVMIDSGNAYAVNPTVSLALSASDTGGSSLTEMRFSNDNSNWSAWEPYSSAKTWTLSAGDGAKTVYAQFGDGAGNVSASVSDGVTLDTILPTTGNSAVQGFTYLGSQLFALSPTDTGSGVASTWYQLDSGAWTLGTSVLVLAPAAGFESHTVSWYSTDVAGNQESAGTVTFTVGAEPVGGTTTLVATMTSGHLSRLQALRLL